MRSLHGVILCMFGCYRCLMRCLRRCCIAGLCGGLGGYLGVVGRSACSLCGVVGALCGGIGLHSGGRVVYTLGHRRTGESK
ncbi:hypothetical protein [Lysobacter sp. HA18]